VEKAKVLIMEDELVLAHDLEDILRQRGYDVVGTASSGEDAIKLAQATNPDLILADIKLQGTLDGIDSAERISEDCDCAIVYLTARTEPDLFDKAKETEPYGYLTKPVAPQELLRTAEMALYKHQMEKRLRESEEKFRLVIENAREAIYVIQGDRVRFANPFALELSGHTEEELYSTPYTELIFTDDREMVRQNYLRRLRGEHAPSRYSFRIVSKRGDRIWVEVDPVMISWEKKNAILVFALDITERKLAEEALRMSEARFSLFMKHFPGLAYIKDTDGKCLFGNHGFARYLGIDESSIVGRTNHEIFPPEFADKITADDKRVIESNEVTEIEEAYGELVWSTCKFPIPQSGELPLLGGFTVDVTRRKRAEEQRERLVLELERSLADLKRLSGLLPICASCKKVRDDKGYWQQIEAYVKDHSEVEFSHGICPECAEKLYPGFFPKDNK
jgi:PAS domain S-box-containing protein